MGVVIEARNLGIQFNRNRKRRLSLREMLFHGRSTAPKGTFWAVDDVSFDVHEGEAVGLIGSNGSGKSTLLRMIAGVLIPDTGSVDVRGGVAPLIEITGGFLKDLTARDNIYLQAGLHGMPQETIEQRFDEIVDFAGPKVKASLDTPLRHFSSGMQARLGFSVITQLDEPIILVDEVLAVGDREFREKCYDRIEEMLAEGRTFFLVAHNESNLRRFCKRGLYLRDGALVADGPIEDVMEQYAAYSDRNA